MQRAHRELEQARAAAELRASTDELTATFNRRRFAQIATESLASTPGRCGLLLLAAGCTDDHRRRRSPERLAHDETRRG